MPCFKPDSEPEQLWHKDGTSRCGPSNRLFNGLPGQCDPDGVSSTLDLPTTLTQFLCTKFEWSKLDRETQEFPCCSPNGYCGNTNHHCRCQHCIDYRQTGDFSIRLIWLNWIERMYGCTVSKIWKLRKSNDLRQVARVKDPEECAQRCAEDFLCDSFELSTDSDCSLKVHGEGVQSTNFIKDWTAGFCPRG